MIVFLQSAHGEAQQGEQEKAKKKHSNEYVCVCLCTEQKDGVLLLLERRSILGRRRCTTSKRKM
jgi:hypothetical protein